MSPEIKYITPEDLAQIVDAIRDFEYVTEEEVPDYDSEQGGIDEYFSLIDRLKEDLYYPGMFEKATGLFLYLNTGHYFSNGNKRIAVFSLTSFLESNNYVTSELSKEESKGVMVETLRSNDFEDFPEFSVKDFAMYNLALISAQFNANGVDFDEAKNRVQSFLQKTYKSK